MAKPILIIEDDKVDQLMIKRAFKKIDPAVELHFCYHGETALDWLEGHKTTPPLFILLDLNMPRMNGIEFLEAISKSPLRGLPTIVITTSAQISDREQCFQNNASGYFLKSGNIEEFTALLRIIYEYWKKCELP